jgi:hypothetical protein
MCLTCSMSRPDARDTCAGCGHHGWIVDKRQTAPAPSPFITFDHAPELADGVIVLAAGWRWGSDFRLPTPLLSHALSPDPY